MDQNLEQLILEHGARFVSRAEAAKVLGISLSTLGRLRHDEGFPVGHKYARRTRFLMADLLRWASHQGG